MAGAQAVVPAVGRRPRSRPSGPACGRSPPTGCRSSTAPAASTTPTSPPATRCRASRWRRPSGRALAEMIATGRGRRCSSRSGSTASAACRCPRVAPHRAAARGGMSPTRRTLRVAIIGSGNIGTDLMMKVERSPSLELVGHRRHRSRVRRPAPGRASAATPSPTDGLAGLLELVDDIDLAFDATSAGAHPEHARLLAERGIRSVDLTPAALGPAVVPPVNLAEHADAPEVNLITCGAQATIPIVAAISARRRRRLRRDRVDDLVALGRARARARTSTSSRRRPRAALETIGGAPRGEGDHHPEPGRPADHDAQHDLRRDRRRRSRTRSRRAIDAAVADVADVRARLPPDAPPLIADGVGRR